MMKARKYLGDGAYARWDGFSYHLAVNRHDNEVIVLEPSVMLSLEEFVRATKKGEYESCKKFEI